MSPYRVYLHMVYLFHIVDTSERRSHFEFSKLGELEWSYWMLDEARQSTSTACAVLVISVISDKRVLFQGRDYKRADCKKVAVAGRWRSASDLGFRFSHLPSGD